MESTHKQRYNHMRNIWQWESRSLTSVSLRGWRDLTEKYPVLVIVANYIITKRTYHLAAKFEKWFKSPVLELNSWINGLPILYTTMGSSVLSLTLPQNKLPISKIVKVLAASTTKLVATNQGRFPCFRAYAAAGSRGRAKLCFHLLFSSTKTNH